MSKDIWMNVPELGRSLPRVTGILEQLHLHWLQQWKIEKAVSLPIDFLRQIQAGSITAEQIKMLDLDEIEHDSINHPNKIGREAADIGTKTHNMIKRYLRAKDGEVIEYDNKIEKPFNAFLTWWGENLIEPIVVEKRYWSLERGGFTFRPDIVCYFGEQRDVEVWDFKTSKDVYDNYKMQIAAYFYGFKERMEDINRPDLIPKRAGILRLDKETGFPEPHRYEVPELAWHYNRFLCQVEFCHRSNS